MDPDIKPKGLKVDDNLDYAWRWFSFHAKQRVDMFNYFLIGTGILAAAFAQAFDKSAIAGAVIAAVGVLLTFAFLMIDKRNRGLYQLGLDVLKNIERDSVPQAYRIASQDTPEATTFGALRQGTHRIYMPIVEF
ncbi:MAG TPA: hypothetical protein VGF18_06575, partial [Candidatus Tumulicola sp.]